MECYGTDEEQEIFLEAHRGKALKAALDSFFDVKCPRGQVLCQQGLVRPHDSSLLVQDPP